MVQFQEKQMSENDKIKDWRYPENSPDGLPSSGYYYWKRSVKLRRSGHSWLVITLLLFSGKRDSSSSCGLLPVTGDPVKDS